MNFRRDQFKGEPEIGRVLQLPGLYTQEIHGPAGTITLKGSTTRRFRIMAVTETEVQTEELFECPPKSRPEEEEN